jgi:HSP20 family protein
MANPTTLPTQEQRSKAPKAESTSSVVYTPRVDILETESELLLFVDMPGVEPEDVNVRYENGELILQGRCTARQERMNYMLWEYGVGDFHRAFTINEVVDAGKITAEMKNGILTVHLPKAEAAKPKKITVKGA